MIPDRLGSFASLEWAGEKSVTSLTPPSMRESALHIPYAGVGDCLVKSDLTAKTMCREQREVVAGLVYDSLYSQRFAVRETMCSWNSA